MWQLTSLPILKPDIEQCAFEHRHGHLRFPYYRGLTLVNDRTRPLNDADIF